MSLGYSMKAVAAYALLLCLCAPARADDWQTVRDCSLIKNESNDGDSFHIEVDGKEKVVRLYFVDTPETDKAGLVSERVTEQAKEFGLTEKETIEIGKKAAAFTRSVLSRPFTILTRGQRAMEASKIPREYAFVETADGEDLGEMLVARGLGRSFGEDASTSSDSAKKLRERYGRLEKEAREQLLGAWGDGAATLTIGLGDSAEDSVADNAPLRPSLDDSNEITGQFSAASFYGLSLKQLIGRLGPPSMVRVIGLHDGETKSMGFTNDLLESGKYRVVFAVYMVGARGISDHTNFHFDKDKERIVKGSYNNTTFDETGDRGPFEISCFRHVTEQ